MVMRYIFSIFWVGGGMVLEKKWIGVEKSGCFTNETTAF